MLVFTRSPVLLNDFYFDGRVLFSSVTNRITFKCHYIILYYIILYYIILYYIILYYITLFIEAVTIRDHAGWNGARIIIEC